MAITNSYMIPNWATPGASGYQNIKPLAGSDAGKLWRYISTSPNDTNVKDFKPQSSNPSTTSPSNIMNSHIAQLQRQTNPQLALYIHGLVNTWSDAVSETGKLG